VLRGSLRDFLAVTVDVEPRIRRVRIEPENLELDRKWLAGSTTASLQGLGLAELSYEGLNARIQSVIDDRNGTLPSESEDFIKFQQRFHFRYADGRRMLTYESVICAKKDRPKYLAANFSGLDFYAAGAESKRIRAPFLTYRERRQLDTRLPAQDAKKFGRESERKCSIPWDDVAQYAKFYPYFPTFADADP
jgi:hypothetical protein